MAFNKNGQKSYKNLDTILGPQAPSSSSKHWGNCLNGNETYPLFRDEELLNTIKTQAQNPPKYLDEGQVQKN
jgi:hypothetical protein